MLRAGALRHLVTVQVATETQDAYGEWVKSWTTAGTAWADIYAKSGQERQLATANQGEVSYTVKMRPFAGLTLAHRINWEGRVLEIKFIDDTTPGELRLDAVEVVGREAL